MVKSNCQFDKYINDILELQNFEKEDILSNKFLLEKENNMEIYYAPHNEIINKNAKIFIIGITPGWTQTQIAYKTAQNGLIQNLSNEEIKNECKKNSRFAGSMRNNLIEMLDELGLNEKLNINSCSELFDKHDTMLHTTSLIPYPVFINKKNYTGSNPKILDNKILTFYFKKYFYEEVEELQNAFLVPLGNSVEEVLEFMIKSGLIKEKQCLFGFPHPSGANGHRKKQFLENKEKLQIKINNFFESIEVK